MFLITNSKMYDRLKWIAQILLPAIGTLYFTLAQLWGFGHTSEVLGTITAVDVFLGVILQLSSTAYNNSDAKYDGLMRVTETDNKVTHELIFDGDPDDIKNKKQVTFKVNKVEAVPKRRTRAKSKVAE